MKGLTMTMRRGLGVVTVHDTYHTAMENNEVLFFVARDLLSAGSVDWCQWQTVDDVEDEDGNDLWGAYPTAYNPYDQRCLEIVSVTIARNHKMQIVAKGCALPETKTFEVEASVTEVCE